MVSPTVKLTAIALGVGGVTVGAGVGIYKNLSKSDERKQNTKGEVNGPQETPKTVTKQSIKALLKQKKILTKDVANNEKWKTKWTTFKTDYDSLKATNESWIIAEYDEKHKSVQDAPEVSKEKCISKGDIQVEGETDKLFQDVLKYCVDGD